MTRTPITVELPVCEYCERAGKIPSGASTGTEYCTGPKGAMHKRVRMVKRRFVEVLEPVTKAEAA